MAHLHLNLKYIYFDEIAAGTKLNEYRLYDKWAKRLLGKTFDSIILKRGYPSKSNIEAHLTKPWRGFTIETISHPLFGPNPVKVFAIIVND